MVTGDSKLTAVAIAKECGIIRAGNENAVAMEGSEFMEKVGGVICSNCLQKKCDCPKRVDVIQNIDAF